MGSGGSKEEVNSKTNRNGVSTTGQAKSTFTPRPEQNNKPKLSSKPDTKTKSENNNTKSTPSRTVTSKFESDSDSEDEVSSKWKGGGDSRTKVTNSNNTNFEKERNGYNAHISAPVTEYPETYAQRNQRAQYTKHEQMLRQKTIYRDPDEWQVEDEVSLGSFDISRFQQANKSNEPKKEMFAMTPDYTAKPVIHYQDRADDFYGAPKVKKQMSVPKYDVSEEELMADIEKDFVY